MPSSNDYTVGWICAITTEYVAAQAFLDEKHEGPEYLSPNDNNDYTLGRIGKHNVVIAVFPQGENGLVSAAGVARDLVHSFPNIRIGLMVGVGGGAPSTHHDIRLGDIVVSCTGNGYGGVFQFDYGKALQEQGFQPGKFLNQPPAVLRTAVSGLVADYESDGHKLKEAVEAVLEKKSRLRSKYQRPDRSTDRLYNSVAVHPKSSTSNCAMVCGTSNLIHRAERTQDEDDPSIHYGLIGSSNTLLKDASIRDEFARKYGILCFEMEAAGLMNHFPCLIVRGICDYCDSHKNKEWQGYAAIAAAAYAKDLLYRIVPSRVEGTGQLRELISAVQTDINDRESKETAAQRESILMWLTSGDYATQQNDIFNQYQPGTCRWLLDTTQFRKWLNSNGSTLFCPGNPGVGKTVFLSMLVNDLQSRFHGTPDVGIAYIYYNV